MAYLEAGNYDRDVIETKSKTCNGILGDSLGKHIIYTNIQIMLKARA